MRKTSQLSVLVLLSLVGSLAPARAANLLVNGNFNLGVAGPVVVQLPNGGAGNSAANNWTVWLNSGGTITTELQPSAIVPQGKRIHVTTNIPVAGLVQVFAPFNGGPTKVYACAWIFLVKGQVAIGTGNGGNTGTDQVLKKIGSWELVEISNGVTPANEFIIYSISPGGAEFYVESAEINVSRVPVCCTAK